MSGQETYRSGKLFFDLSKNMQLMGRWMNEREAVMDEYKLTHQEKEAVRNKDSRALYDLGMNPYLLIGAARFLGIGDPAGGRMLVVLNQEVRLPVYRWLRGVGFVDAGNVFARPRDASLRNLVGSIGFGLRLATPFALLRADYARPVWGRLESSGRWSVGIGHAF